VAVERGKVRVSWGETADAVLLTAGESGLFPRPSAPAPSEQRAALPEQDPVAAANAKEPSARAEQAATQTYRSRVESHDYRGAYAVLDQNPAVAGDTVKDLLLAADVARLSNHPAAAVPYLQRIIHDHPRDERAPMAAFTLGRTLSGLGRTREAMNMFARVQSAWPHSALAEDALLRQAEAASELGDASAARRIAEQYDKSYPNGRRRAEVRRYARLE
jgi:TolA-binding protein